MSYNRKRFVENNRIFSEILDMLSNINQAVSQIQETIRDMEGEGEVDSTEEVVDLEEKNKAGEVKEQYDKISVEEASKTKVKKGVLQIVFQIVDPKSITSN